MAELGPHDLRLMQGLAREVTALRPELVTADASVGELAWVWSKGVDALGESWRHRLWFAGDRVVAWGWVSLSGSQLTWQVHPDRLELLPEILDWYDEVAGETERRVIVQSADENALASVTKHGYAFDADDESWTQANVRELTDLPDPVLPPGFRFRTADEVSVADAVEAHRGAWDRSQLTESDFQRVRQTWPYRGDLHVLVEALDGTLVASAIAWLDEENRIAEFEPVGTHRDFRRRGLGTALQLYGMRQAKAAGATRMMVACLGAATHPAARSLYHGVGFRPYTRDMLHVKAARS
ncbi:GNAT family N-acetyltransferase [Fodinicola acaciae]|uniref:GNAT family N-acetyltransferase n=1 Tax=Fodinicola acaciae TaxID=2681555 RepID=UPI0013CF6D95|nr:GNAT family N-acetyltransferase [Fodinicola acaciae]